MNIHLSAASGAGGLSKLHIALIATGAVALVTAATIPLVSLASRDTHKSATAIPSPPMSEAPRQV